MVEANGPNGETTARAGPRSSGPKSVAKLRALSNIQSHGTQCDHLIEVLDTSTTHIIPIEPANLEIDSTSDIVPDGSSSFAVKDRSILRQSKEIRCM